MDARRVTISLRVSNSCLDAVLFAAYVDDRAKLSFRALDHALLGWPPRLKVGGDRILERRRRMECDAMNEIELVLRICWD